MLSKVCSKVFRSWDWTSNASLCLHGCHIILCWNLDVVSVMVLSQSDQAIHVKIVHKNTLKVLFCSFIYVRNVPSIRRRLWVELGIHKNVVRNMPWILMGDFNVALNMEDIYAGSSRMNPAMCEFKDCVVNIKVMDINSSGLHFTWNQKPKGRNGILKKLDQIRGNIEFLDIFPGAYALFQPYRISDHSPAVLKIPNLPSYKSNPFKFFNFLAYKSKFEDVVAAHWNVDVAGHSMYKVVSKMKVLKKPLRKLLHEYGNLHDRLSKLINELDEVQKALDLNLANPLLREEKVVYVHAFNDAKLDKERFLKQKSKVEWLDVGDSNLTYFHKTIKFRNQKSRIEVVMDSDNVEITGSKVPEVFVSHYEQFLDSFMECQELNVDGLFSNQVSDITSNNMIRAITDEEIRAAMFDIGDDRALGPDGYTFVFFKKG
ncbi:RNA-directed DNA polymerase, eukaryota, reverse transcriptase zinc-binding domain protein [Tanacetum coccineum]